MNTGLLSYKVFSIGIDLLETAFRIQPLQDRSAKLYYRKLKQADDQTFINAVEQIITTEDFFPSIACLRRYCDLQPRLDASGRELTTV